MGRYLKMAEVALLLDVDIETTRKWRKTNVGPPSFVLGGSIRYDEDDLKAWVQARKAATLAGDKLPEAVGH